MENELTKINNKIEDELTKINNKIDTIILNQKH